MRISFRQILTLFSLATLLAVSQVLGGCSPKAPWEDPGPAAVFEGFLMDWFRGDKQAAFNTIQRADREALSAPLEKLEPTLGEEARPGPEDMLVVGRVNNPYDFKSIRLARPLESEPAEGARVELELNFHDGHKGSAWMVWDGARWLVELPLSADAEPNLGSKTPAEQDNAPRQKSSDEPTDD